MGTIIVATDGSEMAREAAAAGLHLLRPGQDVVIATVVDVPDPDLALDATGHAGPTMTPAQLEAEHEGAKAEGRAIVDALETSLRSAALLETEAERLVLVGHPGRELCRLAETADADAIVMGSRGRGGIKRALLGSVSDHVVRNAPCPVVVSTSP
ncbi:MAG: universal stress protein [Acidimicrobiales bacterium]|nr:universal stress protein [Acidimicrobiales bacterium]